MLLVPVAARYKAWSVAARLLGLRVRIMLYGCLFEYCVLPGRDLCVGLITRAEESYRLWCVVVCDREASTLRRPVHWGLSSHGGKGKFNITLAHDAQPFPFVSSNSH